MGDAAARDTAGDQSIAGRRHHAGGLASRQRSPTGLLIMQAVDQQQALLHKNAIAKSGRTSPVATRLVPLANAPSPSFAGRLATLDSTAGQPIGGGFVIGWLTGAPRS